jgi:hypothetical protein
VVLVERLHAVDELAQERGGDGVVGPVHVVDVVDVRADCSRAPVTCGAGLVLSGEAMAEPAIPRQNAAVVEMTAIALNFTLPSQAAARIARPSSDQPRAATLVEAEPSTP